MSYASKLLLPLHLVSILFLLLPFTCEAAAGRVQFVSGNIDLYNAAGQLRKAQKGDEVNEGDTLVSDRNASAQLRMEDGGIIAMRPDTRLKIETFHYTGREDGTEKSVISLLKGGFRAITGVIGKLNKPNYLVRTPTATIGIRGTDHEPMYIPPPLPGEIPIGEPGTYNKVNVGETILQTRQGSINLGPNQVGYAPSADLAPVKLDRIPGFMRSAPVPVARKSGDNKQEDSNKSGDSKQGDNKPRSSPEGDSRLASNERLNSNYGATLTTVQTIKADDGNFVFGGNGDALHPAPLGFAGVGGEMSNQGDAGSGSVLVTGTSGAQILLDSRNNLVALSSTGGFRYSRDSATLITGGSAQVDGIPVNWGVYVGPDTTFDIRGTSDPKAFHFMAAQSTPLSVVTNLSGSATYGYPRGTLVGYTKPTNELGVTGGSVGGATAITFNFTASKITSYVVDVTDAGGRNWNGALSGGPQSIARFRDSNVDLAVTCTACSGIKLGRASGVLIGPNAGGVISSYSMNTTGGQSVVGTFVLKP